MTTVTEVTVVTEVIVDMDKHVCPTLQQFVTSIDINYDWVAMVFFFVKKKNFLGYNAQQNINNTHYHLAIK